jgi:ATP-dependent Lon protease
MKPERIPLFPLNVVLFPGTHIPLHIFEPRYKLMIEHCLEEAMAFGLVLAPTGGIRSVGCTAEVPRVLRKFADGRMDILVAGADVFSLVRLIDEKPYFEALVAYVEDEPPGDLATGREELIHLFQECHAKAFGKPLEVISGLPEATLSYGLAGELPLDLLSKQELLEIRAEAQRRSRLLEMMKEWLPRFERNERVRAKAAGNGHSQH